MSRFPTVKSFITLSTGETMTGPLFLALLFGWLHDTNGQSSAVQVVELDYHQPGENYFEILPNQGFPENMDFAICFRCKFWRWNAMTVFKSDFMELRLTDTTGSFNMYGSKIFSTQKLNFSPTMWNSFCFSLDWVNYNLTIAVNDFRDNFYMNSDALKKDHLRSKIRFGDPKTNAVPSNGFSGQIVDFNFWNRPLHNVSKGAFSSFMSGNMASLFLR